VVSNPKETEIAGQVGGEKSQEKAIGDTFVYVDEDALTQQQRKNKGKGGGKGKKVLSISLMKKGAAQFIMFNIK